MRTEGKKLVVRIVYILLIGGIGGVALGMGVSLSVAFGTSWEIHAGGVLASITIGVWAITGIYALVIGLNYWSNTEAG